MIADLGVNHVERQVLLCGYCVEKRLHDYGIDLVITTYDRHGHLEPGQILVQVKATDHLRRVSRDKAVASRIEQADLAAWGKEPMPVMLVVYDAVADIAYWLYVQEYLEQQPRLGRSPAAAEVTVRIANTNVLTPTAVRHFARCRDRLLRQMKGHVHSHEE